jgi:ubiquinone/menaquinone biosynthesis C-methylase UbiE
MLKYFLSSNLSELNFVDIGCGSGGVAFYVSPHVRTTTGVDPESWERWHDYMKTVENLSFLQESVGSLSISDASIDFVICNQVYEHVPDAKVLTHEIFRILKPSGYCYFAGPNLLFSIEPHVIWPFVHWLPRGFAVRFMRIFGSRAILDAYSTDY